MKNIMGIIDDSFENTGLIKVPNTLERMGSSFGCHLINLVNQEKKNFYHAGKLTNFREHLVIQAPSGFCKTVLMDFFLDQQYGLFSACPFPTSVEATFTQESWMGSILKDPDTGLPCATDGVLERYKHGIIGADEYARFKTMAENPGDANDVVYLLKALDGNRVGKNMAYDKIEIDGICMTFWCGLRPTSLRFTSGLGRRFSYQVYFPTWEEAKAFKEATIEGRADKAIRHNDREQLRDQVYEFFKVANECTEINTSDTYEFLKANKLIPHFDINHYKRMAIGWSVINETFPEVKLDNQMVELFKDEFESRRIVRNSPIEECILRVIEGEERGFEKKFFYAFMDNYYQIPKPQVKAIIRDLRMMGRLEETNGHFRIPDEEIIERQEEKETIDEYITI